eukprot:Sdes_comp16576_c0_seq1m5888
MRSHFRPLLAHKIHGSQNLVSRCSRLVFPPHRAALFWVGSHAVHFSHPPAKLSRIPLQRSSRRPFPPHNPSLVQNRILKSGLPQGPSPKSPPPKNLPRNVHRSTYPRRTMVRDLRYSQASPLKTLPVLQCLCCQNGPPLPVDFKLHWLAQPPPIPPLFIVFHLLPAPLLHICPLLFASHHTPPARFGCVESNAGNVSSRSFCVCVAGLDFFPFQLGNSHVERSNWACVRKFNRQRVLQHEKIQISSQSEPPKGPRQNSAPMRVLPQLAPPICVLSLCTPLVSLQKSFQSGLPSQFWRILRSSERSQSDQLRNSLSDTFHAGRIPGVEYKAKLQEIIIFFSLKYIT